MVEQDRSASNETIAKQLLTKLKARSVQMRTLNVEHVVPQDKTASQNAQTWFEAETLKDARGKVIDVNLIVDGLYCSLLTVIRFKPARLSSAKPVALLRLRLPQRSRLKILVFPK